MGRFLFFENGAAAFFLADRHRELAYISGETKSKVERGEKNMKTKTTAKVLGAALLTMALAGTTTVYAEEQYTI